MSDIHDLGTMNYGGRKVIDMGWIAEERCANPPNPITYLILDVSVVLLSPCGLEAHLHGGDPSDLQVSLLY